MNIYYETVHREQDSDFPTHTAHETFDAAAEFAEIHGIEYIHRVGGDWAEFVRCPICGEWYESSDISEDGLCGGCEFAGRQHGF